MMHTIKGSERSIAFRAFVISMNGELRSAQAFPVAIIRFQLKYPEMAITT